MKAIAMTVALLCAGCDDTADNIYSCGEACKDAGSHMLKYSIADGCVCAPRANAEVPK